MRLNPALLAIGLLGLPGCGTLTDVKNNGYRVYGGVQYDVGTELIGGREPFPLNALVLLVDLPLSIGVDTALLPTYGFRAFLNTINLDVDCIDGVVLEAARTEWHLAPTEDKPTTLRPLLATLRVVTEDDCYRRRREYPIRFTSDDTGHFRIKIPWGLALMAIRVEAPGYPNLEIPLDSCPLLADKSSWSKHRLEIHLSSGGTATGIQRP
jgi:uncharacterized protein YceK